MCCLSRKTFCASKVRRVPQSVASATPTVAKVIIRERSRLLLRFCQLSVKGFSLHFRCIEWKPSWIGFTACPPRRVRGTNTGQWVRGSRRFGIETPGFHFNPPHRHGEGRCGGFLTSEEKRPAIKTTLSVCRIVLVLGTFSSAAASLRNAMTGPLTASPNARIREPARLRMKISTTVSQAGTAPHLTISVQLAMGLTCSPFSTRS
jgi:hypothetical protein